MKKNLVLLCVGLLLAALLVGCAGGAAPATDAPETNASEQTAPEGMYILCNNTAVALGMNYADVKEGLGEEAAPAQDVLPCDGNEDNKLIMHFYGGMAITENTEGIITDIEISDLYEGESDAALMGKVKRGTTQAEAVEALGEPDVYPVPEDDYALTYNTETQYIYVFLDPDNNKETVSGISMLLVQP